jgi:hypothetical protein
MVVATVVAGCVVLASGGVGCRAYAGGGRGRSDGEKRFACERFSSLSSLVVAKRSRDVSLWSSARGSWSEVARRAAMHVPGSVRPAPSDRSPVAVRRHPETK